MSDKNIEAKVDELIAYVLDYSVGLTAAQQATFYLVGSIFNYVGLLGGTWIANHIGKRD